MGEYADMVLDGHLCQSCGEYIDDGAAGGYARFCATCTPDAPAPQRKARKLVKCKLPGCMRTFATEAARDQHIQDRHRRARPTPQEGNDNG